MKVELKVNGKTVQVEMTEEQLKELGVIKPRTGYERRKECNNEYYLVTAGGSVIEEKDTALFDQNCYEIGNFYSNKMIAENNARADRLLRQLRQWQALNDKSISVEDWKDNGKNKWCIIYGYGLEKLYVDYFHCIRLHNVIYFTTREKAEEAIEVFRDELIWYFVEYQQRLDEE